MYPDQPEALVALLMANPWVSRHPPMMLAGLDIALPELEQDRKPKTLLRLFG